MAACGKSRFVTDDPIYRIATWLVPLVFAIVLHEISHGWAALAFGDRTAQESGRLSPNPIRHVDPVGTIALPLVLAFVGAPIFGWAKPVPVRADRMRNPRLNMMLVALAGPFMNFFLALLSAIAIAAALRGGASDFLVANLANFLAINLFLGLFNLLPLPPFDGGHVVEGLLPRPLAAHYQRLARFGFPLLIFLLVILPMIAPKVDIVGRAVMPPFLALLRLLGRIAGY
jgi:Zn-dependent protease